MDTVKVLDLSHNKFTSTLPIELFKSGVNSPLAEVYLNNNEIVGVLPPEIQQLTSVETLR